jgi:hypothetical protein
MTSVFVIGDLHGQYDSFVSILQQAQLVDERLHWSGSDAQLWLIGDFFDRGAEGAECVTLAMNLQKEAEAAGGKLGALLGNHELMLLCASRFDDARTGSGISVRDLWFRWGGVAEDLEKLGPGQLAWVSNLPAMVLLGDRLMIHADSIMYVDYGATIEAVNRSFAELTQCDDLARWESALSAFTEHEAFSLLPQSGRQKADMMLRYFGGSRIIHGHTPISVASGTPSHEVTEAWEYAQGLCINVDGGLYLGGPGFVHHFTFE